MRGNEMEFKAKIVHMAKVVQLMKEKLFLNRFYNMADGMYLIRFGKAEGNLEWWGMCRDGGYYSMFKLNHSLSFKVVYHSMDPQWIIEPEEVVEKITEQLEKTAHYQFY